MPNELVHHDATTPMAMIETAIAKGVDPEQLSKLLDLQERWERNRAADSFAAALTTFQAQMPVVKKAQTAKVKDWSYTFASYDDVMRAAAPILAQCKLAISFSTEPAQGALKVTCRVRHGIHFEEHSLTVPIPDMRVSDTQKFGAALSYAKRYAVCAALNIVVSDEDDDAASQLDSVNAKEAAILKALVVEKKADLGRFLKWANVESIQDMPRSMYAKAVDMLRRKP